MAPGLTLPSISVDQDSDNDASYCGQCGRDFHEPSFLTVRFEREWARDSRILYPYDLLCVEWGRSQDLLTIGKTGSQHSSNQAAIIHRTVSVFCRTRSRVSHCDWLYRLLMRVVVPPKGAPRAEGPRGL